MSTIMSILLQATEATAEAVEQVATPVQEAATAVQEAATTAATTAATQEEPSGWGNIIFIVALVAIFYFFMIRPQSKRQKEIRKFRDSLRQGDKVITAGGIHGKIKNVKENSVVLEIADGMNITVEKSSIYATAPDASEQPQK